VLTSYVFLSNFGSGGAGFFAAQMIRSSSVWDGSSSSGLSHRRFSELQTAMTSFLNRATLVSSMYSANFAASDSQSMPSGGIASRISFGLGSSWTMAYHQQLPRQLQYLGLTLEFLFIALVILRLISFWGPGPCGGIWRVCWGHGGTLLGCQCEFFQLLVSVVLHRSASKQVLRKRTKFYTAEVRPSAQNGV
jgi:hypothetical protein